MNVSQLQPVIKALYNAGMTGMVWGAPGLGKSFSFREAARSLCKDLGLDVVLERHEVRAYLARGGNIKNAFGMFDLRLVMCDPVDIGGLPRENKANGSMERVPPSWFAHTARNDLPDYGILLLDELPAASPSVQATAYQIALDNVIDEFRLKEGWSVFAAGNRLKDGGSFNKMPHALANRMSHIEVESDLDSWVDWALDKGIQAPILAFVRFRPESLNQFDEHVGKKRQGNAFATERMWEKVDTLLANNATGQVDQNGTPILALDDVTLQSILGGMIGDGTTAEFLGFRNVWTKMPNIQSIFIDPQSAQLPEDSATQFAISTALAAATTFSNVDNAVIYMDRFQAMGRPELTVLWAKDMQRRSAAERAKNPQFQDPSSNGAYANWLTRNAGLFA